MKEERVALVKQIFSFMPMIHRKFFRGMHMKKSMYKLQLLGAIFNKNGMPMKYYGELLFISKPNLTKMVNRLIEDAYVERKHDENDRRVIKIFITEEGKAFIEEHKRVMRNKMLERLEGLSDEEITALSHHFEEVEKILDKLNS